MTRPVLATTVIASLISLDVRNWRVIGLRGGEWCAYGWVGDRLISATAYRAGDALERLASTVSFMRVGPRSVCGSAC